MRIQLFNELKSVLFVYEGFSHDEIELVESLFTNEPRYKVLIVTSQVLWNLNIKCPYVIVADVNSSYTNRPLVQNYYTQYDLQYILSLANPKSNYNKSDQDGDEDLECIFLLENNKKEEVKRMLYDSAVLESNLELSLEEALNNE
ncbi:uncharacterized protein TA18065 [Theileria annulata]|uniref:Uncharacterized protein n=1 Tax=Theileria annulata TaxID=5874 RepID=Q4UB38_THEAN|nr:uncharacterized protein TA18065 [Theileria annulata]CAI75963.1 hypothetical protein TA18065 [Theileria annulata]|eukprot:XP_955439.1 hypothetical protein TA18065 [Theileria annulata]